MTNPELPERQTCEECGYKPTIQDVDPLTDGLCHDCRRRRALAEQSRGEA